MINCPVPGCGYRMRQWKLGGDHRRSGMWCPSCGTRSGMKKKPLKERFESKFIKSDGCWLWLGMISPRGYGTIGARLARDQKYRLWRAHRLSWILYRGPIPKELFVCHTCDVPTCVNPDHLFLGTHTDNMRDMWNKGRGNPPGLKGEKSPAAKLTTEQVLMIRVDTRTHRAIAADFGIDHSNVTRIKSMEHWGHV